MELKEGIKKDGIKKLKEGRKKILFLVFIFIFFIELKDLWIFYSLSSFFKVFVFFGWI